MYLCRRSDGSIRTAEQTCVCLMVRNALLLLVAGSDGEEDEVELHPASGPTWVKLGETPRCAELSGSGGWNFHFLVVAAVIIPIMWSPLADLSPLTTTNQQHRKMPNTEAQ